jgi:hypothetical protein
MMGIQSVGKGVRRGEIEGRERGKESEGRKRREGREGGKEEKDGKDRRN